jgi:hypothetical protein
MADDELVAASSTLSQAGRDLWAAAEKLNLEWQNMQGVADGVTFGNDIVSALIGASYQAAHGMAQKTYDSAAAAFADFGKNIVDMGGVYDQTELGNIETVRQIGGAA